MSVVIKSLAEHVYDGFHTREEVGGDDLHILLPQINSLLKELKKLSGSPDSSPAPELIASDVYNVILQEGSFVAAAIDEADPENPRLVGMASIFVYSKFMRRTGLIDDVVVDEAHQRRGLASKLTEELIEYARKSGVAVIELTSNPKRVGARALYLKLGFVKKETDTFQLKLS